MDPASLAASLIQLVSASGLQPLTVLVLDIVVAGVFLPWLHLTKEAICFNETGSQSETLFFCAMSGESKNKISWQWSNGLLCGSWLFQVTFVLVEQKPQPAFKAMCLNKRLFRHCYQKLNDIYYHVLISALLVCFLGDFYTYVVHDGHHVVQPCFQQQPQTDKPLPRRRISFQTL